MAAMKCWCGKELIIGEVLPEEQKVWVNCPAYEEGDDEHESRLLPYLEVDFLAAPDSEPERSEDEIEELVCAVAERYGCLYEIFWNSRADRGHGQELTVAFAGENASEAAADLQQG